MLITKWIHSQGTNFFLGDGKTIIIACYIFVFQVTPDSHIQWHQFVDFTVTSWFIRLELFFGGGFDGLVSFIQDFFNSAGMAGSVKIRCRIS